MDLITHFASIFITLCVNYTIKTPAILKFQPNVLDSQLYFITKKYESAIKVI